MKKFQRGGFVGTFLMLIISTVAAGAACLTGVGPDEAVGLLMLGTLAWMASDQWVREKSDCWYDTSLRQNKIARLVRRASACATLSFLTGMTLVHVSM